MYVFLSNEWVNIQRNISCGILSNNRFIFRLILKQIDLHKKRKWELGLDILHQVCSKTKNSSYISFDFI